VVKGFGRGLALIALLAVCLFTAGARGAIAYRAGDIDGDGAREAYTLARHRLTVREGGRVLWRTDSDWRVEAFALGDIDHDGDDELVLTLWKKGSYGKLKPFWHTGEDISYKNHLFVYRLTEDGFRPVWCSSDLARPIVSFSIMDADGDGRSELVTEEGAYRQVAGERYALDTGKPTRTTVWQWEGWGFYREDEQ
jgi:hypothetical protein